MIRSLPTFLTRRSVVILVTMILFLNVAGISGSNVAALPIAPPSGLVGWWPGEGNANDIVGNNDGTLQGDATFATGQVGQAFSFDGTGDYVDVGDIGVTGDWTVDFWAKLDTAVPTIQYPIGTGTRSGATYGAGIFVAYSGAGDKWGMYDGLSWIPGTTVTTAGVWYFVAVTKSGTQLNQGTRSSVLTRCSHDIDLVTTYSRRLSLASKPSGSRRLDHRANRRTTGPQTKNCVSDMRSSRRDRNRGIRWA